MHKPSGVRCSSVWQQNISALALTLFTPTPPSPPPPLPRCLEFIVAVVLANAPEQLPIKCPASVVGTVWRIIKPICCRVRIRRGRRGRFIAFSSWFVLKMRKFMWAWQAEHRSTLIYTPINWRRV